MLFAACRVLGLLESLCLSISINRIGLMHELQVTENSSVFENVNAGRSATYVNVPDEPESKVSQHYQFIPSNMQFQHRCNVTIVRILFGVT
jgi:hypothetical protein